jgi:hypothetical protein
MSELRASEVRFDGVGASAGSAEEAARVLAARLNHWLADHHGCRIVDFSVQSAGAGAGLELTAILAFIDEATSAAAASEATAVLEAEEIIAEAEQRDTPR